MDENRNQPPKRFQFSLRALFLVTTACAVIMAVSQVDPLLAGCAIFIFLAGYLILAEVDPANLIADGDMLALLNM